MRIVCIVVLAVIGLDVRIVLKCINVRAAPRDIVRSVTMVRNTVSSTARNAETTIALNANLN